MIPNTGVRPIERTLLLEPRPGIDWEDNGVINPGVARLPDDNIAMVYRGMKARGPSSLGFCILEPEGSSVIEGSRSEEPLSIHDAEAKRLFPDGFADPRMNIVDNWYYIWAAGQNNAALDHYRAMYDNDFSEQYLGGRQIAALRTQNFRDIQFLGLYGPLEFYKNAFLHPEKVAIDGVKRHALFHRIKFSIQVATADQIEDFGDQAFWHKHVKDINRHVFAEPMFDWEGVGVEKKWPGQIAGGSPPVKLTPDIINPKSGDFWLTFYNGAGAPRAGTYPRDRSAGCIIYTAKTNPTHEEQPFEVFARTPQPVLWPEEPHEKDGPSGDVVFVTGALRTLDKKSVDVFFGSGDRTISKARFDLSKLVHYVAGFDDKGKPRPGKLADENTSLAAEQEQGALFCDLTYTKPGPLSAE